MGTSSCALVSLVRDNVGLHVCLDIGVLKQTAQGIWDRYCGSLPPVYPDTLGMMGSCELGPVGQRIPVWGPSKCPQYRGARRKKRAAPGYLSAVLYCEGHPPPGDPRWSLLVQTAFI